MVPTPGVTTKVVQSKDGTSIFADAIGDPTKPHVVFLHGFACAAASFDPLFGLEDLRRNLFMVRYDARGHGRSGKPVTKEAYESIRYAEDFAAVVQEFKLETPVFTGWSLGGAIVADICANFNPIPISGVIWISGLPYMGEPLKSTATPAIVPVLAGFAAPESSAHALQVRLDFCDLFAAPDRDVPFAVMASWVGAATHLPSECALLLQSREQDPTRLKEEGENGLPLCLIQGARDLVASHKDVVEQAQGIFNNCEVNLLEGIGHIPFWEDPNEVARLILKFVQRIE